MEQVSSSKCFGGHQKIFQHKSRELGCTVKFSVFIPSCATDEQPVPLLYFLSGLTCTEQNFITKSSFQKYAEKYKLAVVGPDTSPRGENVPNAEDWDLGQGAGFYVDATQPKWNKNFRMYSYITKELFDLVKKNFKCIDTNNVGISGHSMGGHGALIAFLRNPHIYKSVSAFAPISNPTASNWGRKCFTDYLGTDEEAWSSYDATELVRRQPQKRVKIVVEQGSLDEWMHELVPDNFVKACREVGQDLTYNLREGYDHGYYFISTFIEDHIAHHAGVLHSKSQSTP